MHEAKIFLKYSEIDYWNRWWR